jgi:chromosome segregation ATPase
MARRTSTEPMAALQPEGREQQVYQQSTSRDEAHRAKIEALEAENEQQALEIAELVARLQSHQGKIVALGTEIGQQQAMIEKLQFEKLEACRELEERYRSQIRKLQAHDQTHKHMDTNGEETQQIRQAMLILMNQRDQAIEANRGMVKAHLSDVQELIDEHNKQLHAAAAAVATAASAEHAVAAPSRAQAMRPQPPSPTRGPVRLVFAIRTKSHP